jgi:hypothetical protein
LETAKEKAIITMAKPRKVCYKSSGQAGVKKFRVGPRTEEFVWMGKKIVFPRPAIQELASDLSTSLGCYTPLEVIEAAAVSFVAALGKYGWKVFAPCIGPQSLPK